MTSLHWGTKGWDCKISDRDYNNYSPLFKLHTETPQTTTYRTYVFALWLCFCFVSDENKVAWKRLLRAIFSPLKAAVLELNIPVRWKAFISHIHVDWKRCGQKPIFLVSSLLDLIPVCAFTLIWPVKSTLLTLCRKLRPCYVFDLFTKARLQFISFTFFNTVSAVSETKMLHKAQGKSNIYTSLSAFKLSISRFYVNTNFGFESLAMLWYDVENQ